jgi:hypothetical protein
MQLCKICIGKPIGCSKHKCEVRDTFQGWEITMRTLNRKRPKRSQVIEKQAEATFPFFGKKEQRLDCQRVVRICMVISLLGQFLNPLRLSG